MKPLRSPPPVLEEVDRDQQDDPDEERGRPKPLVGCSVIRRMEPRRPLRVCPRMGVSVFRRMERGRRTGHELSEPRRRSTVNTLPLHPAVVHVPLGLALVMPVLLAGLLWAVYTNRLPRAAWLVGLVLQGVLLGAALVALRTGEQDEERAEVRATEAQVDAHAHAARAFTWAAGATFAAAGLAFGLRTRLRAFAGAGLA